MAFVPQPAVTNGPLIYGRGTTSVVVWWATDIEGSGHQIKYFQPGDEVSGAVLVAAANRVAVDDASSLVYFHSAELTGLTPGTTYNFVVQADQGLDLRLFTFDTLGSSEDFKAAVFGESQGNIDSGAVPGLSAMNDYAVSQGVVTYLGVGGYVEDGSKLGSWTDGWFASTVDSVDNPLVPISTTNGGVAGGGGVVGVRGVTDGNSLMATSVFPLPGPSDRYFKLDMGSLYVVGLDTSVPSELKPGKAQHDFFMDQVVPTDAWKNASYRVLLVNKPFRTTYWNSTCNYETDGTDEDLEAYLQPIIKQSGVDVVFHGLSRSYQRGGYPSTHPAGANAVHHIVIGGAGAPLHQTRCYEWDPPTEPGIVTDAKLHTLAILDITTSRMVVEIHDYVNSVTIDSFTVTPHTLVQP